MATQELADHEGKPVRRTSIEVRNLAGGLRKAAKTNPAVIGYDEKAYIVAEVVGTKHAFNPMDDGDAWERVNICNAETVTVVDRDLVIKLIEEQRDRNLKLEEEEKNIQQIPDVDRAEEHRAGQHKRPRKDCELCAVEKAEKDEAKAQAKLDPDAPPARARGAAKKATGSTSKRAGRGRGNLTGIDGGGKK